MNQPNEDQYIIPSRYRRMENMHIAFWLVKDISWCLIWKVLGIIMIVPTLTVAILIAWRTRKLASELAHNLAVAFWISANSFWMISEFLGFDEKNSGVELRVNNFHSFPFLSGLSYCSITIQYNAPGK